MPASHASLDLDQLQVVFNDPHAVANAGLLPAILADRLGIQSAADELVGLAGPPGAHPGAKLLTLIHGILAGGDCIDDVDVLRRAATSTVLGHRVLARPRSARFCARSPSATPASSTTSPRRRWRARGRLAPAPATRP
jgi:hypothetical protein